MEQNVVRSKPVKWLWTATCLLVLIAMVVVIRRVLIIGEVIPASSGRGPDFESGFRVPAVLTLLHIIPGLLFILLGPLQFIKGIRRRYKNFHRYSGRVFIIAAYIIGISALAMPFISMPIGGITEAAGSVVFALFFLFAVTKALRSVLQKQIALHREWMLRTFATGLAVATVRPVMALAFILFGQTPQEFLGTAFWIGFTLHLMAAETWIYYTRQNKKPEEAA